VIWFSAFLLSSWCGWVTTGTAFFDSRLALLDSHLIPHPSKMDYLQRVYTRGRHTLNLFLNLNNRFSEGKETGML
jgi:hypothetical protein